MHPILFELPGGYTVHAYGTLILLAALLSVPAVRWDFARRALASGAQGTLVMDFYLVLLVGSWVGGRLLDAILRPDVYRADLLRIAAPEATGFVYYGSLALALAGLVWLARRYRTTVGTLVDVLATWLPGGHCLARLGCFLAGCCYGAPSMGLWGVRFPPGSVAFRDPTIPHVDSTTVALHPTQLYEALGLGLLFGVLVARRLRRGVEPPWRQASRYAVLYAGVRLVVEIFRGDGPRFHLPALRWPALARLLDLPPEQYLGVSTAQWLSLLLLGLGVWGLRRTRG